MSNHFVKKAMDNDTNCARLSNKNWQKLFKGKKGAKNIRASLFFLILMVILTGIRSCRKVFINPSIFAQRKSLVTNVRLFNI